MKMKVLNLHLEEEQYNKLKDLAIQKSLRERRKASMVEIIRGMIENYKEDKNGAKTERDSNNICTISDNGCNSCDSSNGKIK